MFIHNSNNSFPSVCFLAVAYCWISWAVYPCLIPGHKLKKKNTFFFAEVQNKQTNKTYICISQGLNRLLSAMGVAFSVQALHLPPPPRGQHCSPKAIRWSGDVLMQMIKTCCHLMNLQLTWRTAMSDKILDVEKINYTLPETTGWKHFNVDNNHTLPLLI